jgi:hypothetical protein
MVLVGVLALLLVVATFVWLGFGVVLIRDREFFLSVPVLAIGVALAVLFVALIMEVL